jgi:hypothetical protein
VAIDAARVGGNEDVCAEGGVFGLYAYALENRRDDAAQLVGLYALSILFFDAEY